VFGEKDSTRQAKRPEQKQVREGGTGTEQEQEADPKTPPPPSKTLWGGWGNVRQVGGPVIHQGLFLDSRQRGS